MLTLTVLTKVSLLLSVSPSHPVTQAREEKGRTYEHAWTDGQTMQMNYNEMNSQQLPRLDSDSPSEWNYPQHHREPTVRACVSPRKWRKPHISHAEWSAWRYAREKSAFARSSWWRQSHPRREEREKYCEILSCQRRLQSQWVLPLKLHLPPASSSLMWDLHGGYYPNCATLIVLVFSISQLLRKVCFVGLNDTSLGWSEWGRTEGLSVELCKREQTRSQTSKLTNE